MGRRKLYSRVILMLVLTSCNVDKEIFVVTEFSENVEIEKNFYKLHNGRTYYWDSKINKSVVSDERITIKYDKMPLSDIVSQLGYHSQRKHMAKNPIISIYYNKENTTQEKAKSEIMDVLYRKYRLDYVNLTFD